MLRWMVYVVIVTLLLTVAAVMGERALRLRRRMTRWVWVTAIVGSLAIPTIIASVSIQVPSILTPGAPGEEIALRDSTSLPLDALSQVAMPHALARPDPGLDTLLGRGWLTASGAMLLLLCLSALQLALRMRRWTPATLAGLPVYIAPDVGPAVVGLLRPRIVLPPWVLESSPACQADVMLHEQSHLAARDPLVLTLALGLLVFMPWNLPLWWQLRQLRHAIEVDCDARVLRAGHDVHRYGETLLKVAARQSTFIGTVAAMSESGSFLEQRLRMMVRRPGRAWQTCAALLGFLAIGLVAVAAQVSPPNHDGAAGEAVALDPSVYDAYAGSYLLADNAVMHIWRDGKRFFTRLTGQGPVEIFPASATEYFAKVVNAQITFTPDGRGRGVALTLHQNGMNLRAPRIDDRAAQKIEDRVSERVKSQTPYPGSEAALRRYYSSMLAGKPDYAQLTPELAALVRQESEQIQTIAPTWGPIESVQFRGVGNQGWDVYVVHHPHVTLTWRIAMAPDGKISGLAVEDGP